MNRTGAMSRVMIPMEKRQERYVHPPLYVPNTKKFKQSIMIMNFNVKLAKHNVIPKRNLINIIKFDFHVEKELT